MHVISRKMLRSFWEQHHGSELPLRRWYKIVSATSFAGFGDVRKTFPSADMVDKFVVFNIGGNKFRVVASIHFNRGKVYVRHVLTHAEYDRGGWKK
jgi:mRNA interferase HigB